MSKNFRFCQECVQTHSAKFCPLTRLVSPWTDDGTGILSRTVTGGVCAKQEASREQVKHA